MLILFCFSLVFSATLKELGGLLSSQINNPFSPKDYLTLEAQHHPSWILRKLFRFLLDKLHQGKTLAQLAQPLGLFLPHHVATVFDLKNIFLALGTEHPVEYPWSLIFRLSVLCIFKVCTQSVVGDLLLWSLIAGIAIILCKEQWDWVWYKIRLTELYCWECDLSSGLHFSEGFMRPKFLKNAWERKIWRQILQLDRDLDQSALLFSAYWRSHNLRQALLRRRGIIGVLQVSTFLLFIASVTPVLNGFYQGQFLA